ncbi:Hsp70 family protein [Trichothermofontia sp.]
MTYAIDFGTSNTVIARWNQATQQPEVLDLNELSLRQGENPPVIPSLLYVEDAAQGRTIVGQLVRDRGLDIHSNPRFFRNFKRGIGTPVQGFLPELDDRAISFEQVGQWFLERVVTTLRQMTPTEIDTLVLTVPVDSFEAYRHWLGQVCQTLSIPQVRLLDEPTAAALGYGVADRPLLLVLDFGGGTCDLSLVRLDWGRQPARKPLGFILKWGDRNLAATSGQRPRLARVLAKAGLTLGGADIDHWLVDYFVQTQGVTASPLVTRLAERLKIQLSSRTQATAVLFDDATLDSYELSLDRPQLEAILQAHQFFQRLDEAMTQVLQQARRQGIEATDIDAVLLVGGTAQMPAVQSWAQTYFAADKIQAHKPFTAIATGALQLHQGTELKDFLYHSYGIRYWNRRKNHHDWHPLIPVGQAYPMPEPVELVLGASVEQQPSIELIIGELGSDQGSTEVYFEGDRLVTKSVGHTKQVRPLNDREGARTIARLDPPGFPGSDRIKVQFWVDEKRFLRITVEDLLTHQILLANQKVVQLS